jgi:hypothetical protein
MQRAKPSTEQLAMIEHIGEALDIRAGASRRSVPAPQARKSARKSVRKRGTGK